MKWIYKIIKIDQDFILKKIDKYNKKIKKLIDNKESIYYCHRYFKGKDDKAYYDKIKNINNKDLYNYDLSGLNMKLNFLPKNNDFSLSKYDNWADFRKNYIQKNGLSECKFCCKKKNKQNNDQFILHENWSFNKLSSSSNNIWIDDFLFVCNDCHNAIHFNNIFAPINEEIATLKDSENEYNKNKIISKFNEINSLLKDIKKNKIFKHIMYINKTSFEDTKKIVFTYFKIASAIEEKINDYKIDYGSIIKKVKEISEKLANEIREKNKIN